ncbi:DUF3429 domain-containing protein [Marinomonas colpomeniae]|uniref:DUF3429 domain-containing protein n=1 Tax=Marinomonas colpomeniae TaxID=2774408 RepID=A0ABR8NU83_9GAMM|nr:DUF3429 domain-containing protein [Marinomonas colpomeniae]MBD5769611.1 DUF3429 domain-containing protein [Marinomonas colpomeniae]
MRTSSSILSLQLSVLGIIPFAFSTYLSWTNQMLFDESGSYLFTTYSAIILSFLSGTLWGQCINKRISTMSQYLLISSNVIALGAWFSLLLEVSSLSIALLLLGFISLFWVEARSLREENSVHSRYLNMRFGITLIVCVLHLLMLYPHD